MVCCEGLSVALTASVTLVVYDCKSTTVDLKTAAKYSPWRSRTER